MELKTRGLELSLFVYLHSIEHHQSMLPLKVPYVNINGSLSNVKAFIDQAKGCMEFLFTQGTTSCEGLVPFRRAVRDFYASDEGKACEKN